MGDRYERTFGAPYYGVHRVALLQALGDQLAGEGLNLGRRCEGIEESDSGVELRFADGTTATADVVVGADGVHSVIRPHLAGPVRGRFSGTVGYRGLVPVEDMPSLPDPTPLQFWAGPRTAPAPLRDRRRADGQLPRGRACPGVDERDVDGECEVGDAVDTFAGWHPAVTEMVGATEVGARWALHDLAPLKRWHTDRVVRMGDAAQMRWCRTRARAPTPRSRTRSSSPEPSRPPTTLPAHCASHRDPVAGAPHRRPAAPPGRTRYRRT